MFRVLIAEADGSQEIGEALNTPWGLTDMEWAPDRESMGDITILPLRLQGEIGLLSLGPRADFKEKLDACSERAANQAESAIKEARRQKRGRNELDQRVA